MPSHFQVTLLTSDGRSVLYPPTKGKRKPCVCLPCILSNVHNGTRATDSPCFSAEFLSILTTPWCRVARNVLHHTYPLEYQIRSSQPKQKSCWARLLGWISRALHLYRGVLSWFYCDVCICIVQNSYARPDGDISLEAFTACDVILQIFKAFASWYFLHQRENYLQC
jgi:hypothetical protein